MNPESYIKPSLIEPGVKYFLNETLNKCQEYKIKYYNTLYNIIFGILFFIVLGIILYYKYKGKLTPAQKMEKDREKQQYIMSTIRNYQNAKRIAQQELITGLPQW